MISSSSTTNNNGSGPKPVLLEETGTNAMLATRSHSHAVPVANLSPGKRLMYDQARKLQLSFVELHGRAEALLVAGRLARWLVMCGVCLVCGW